MRFVYPWVLTGLLLLPLVGLLGFWILSRGSRRLADFVSPEMQVRLAPARRPVIVTVQLVLMLTGLFLLIVAAARPQWGRADVRIQARGRNLLIALDVSRSMLAGDVHPNRLERAKADLLDLLVDLRGDRAGILVFRGKANMLCPLTTDRAFLRQTLDGISIDSAPRGETDLADALQKSLDALKSAFDENNAIMLITDGEDLAGRSIEVAKKAAERGIPVFTVGLGDPEGTTIPNADGTGVLKYQGKAVITRLDEATLAKIAQITGGTYIPLATSGTASTTLGAIYRQHLTRVAAREHEEHLQRRYIERYPLFLIPSILLLLVTAMLSRGRMAGSRKTPTPPPLPGRRGTTLILFLAVILSGTTAAAASSAPDPVAPTASTITNQTVPAVLSETNVSAMVVPPGREGARMAQKLYRRGKYAEAAEAYLSAARGAEPSEAHRYRYNAGLARYKSKNMEEAAKTLHPMTMLSGQAAAAELYGAARFKEADGAVASTNMALRLKLLEQAGAGFQQALRQSSDEARRHRNLNRTIKNLPELREAAHIERVLAEHGQTPPETLLNQMLQEQRALLEETPVAFTNEHADAMIRDLEALSQRQKRNCDLWIPLKRALIESQAITNEQERAQVAERIEQARDTMKSGARKLADLDGEGVSQMAAGEQAAYNFWQLLAMPPGLVAEAIQAQTNAWAHPQQPRQPYRSDAEDAAQLTQLFQAKFAPWADQVQQQAQSDTNAPSLSPEARAEIEGLTTETMGLHEEILKSLQQGTARPADLQFQALKNLEQIQDLLPKQKQQQQQQDQSGQQEQQQQQQQEQQQDQSEPQEQEQEQQQQEDEQEQEQPEEQPAESSDEPPPEVQEVLRRALEREKEHEAEKRRLNREFPMAPSARDW